MFDMFAHVRSTAKKGVDALGLGTFRRPRWPRRAGSKGRGTLASGTRAMLVCAPAGGVEGLLGCKIYSLFRSQIQQARTFGGTGLAAKHSPTKVSAGRKSVMRLAPLQTLVQIITLLTEKKIESGTSQSKSGTSAN